MNTRDELLCALSVNECPQRGVIRWSSDLKFKYILIQLSMGRKSVLNDLPLVRPAGRPITFSGELL